MPDMPGARDLVCLRMRQQRLSSGQLNDPAEVVKWLGAVQAQDYQGAKWALGLRTRGATDATVENAFDGGEILRTHVMRPTWHFVAPQDIRWMLELTASRVALKSAYMHRQVSLDRATFIRSNQVIARALEGRRWLTREELGQTLSKAGVTATGVRLTYLVMQAELDAIVCSGPRRGKRFTYALLDERAPLTKKLEPKEALAELARRYFTAHGPATVKDFAWWSGLTVADAWSGLESAGSLASGTFGNEIFWSSTSMPREEDATGAFLLPTYDELLIGYSSFDRVRRGGGESQGRNLIFTSPVILDGRVAGSWRRRLAGGTALVEVAPFGRLSSSQSEEVEAAADRYGSFIGMPVTCAFSSAL